MIAWSINRTFDIALVVLLDSDSILATQVYWDANPAPAAKACFPSFSCLISGFNVAQMCIGQLSAVDTGPDVSMTAASLNITIIIEYESG